MKTPSIKKIHSIIKNKVEGVWIPAHDEKGHHYRHRDSGILVDSVTTKIILEKEHIVPWAVEIGIRDFISKIQFYDPDNEDQTNRMIEVSKFAWRGARDDAGNIGTKSHDTYEFYIKNWIATGKRITDIKSIIPKDADPRVFATVRSAEKFFNDFPAIVPIASELLVGDEEWGVAGTLDFLVLWDERLWLIDFKTSNSPAHDDYALQVSAYKKLFEKMTDLKIEGCSILGVSKGYDRYTLLDVIGPGSAFIAFRGITRVYDWKYNGKDKLIVRKNRAII